MRERARDFSVPHQKSRRVKYEEAMGAAYLGGVDVRSQRSQNVWNTMGADCTWGGGGRNATAALNAFIGPFAVSVDTYMRGFATCGTESMLAAGVGVGARRPNGQHHRET